MNRDVIRGRQSGQTLVVVALALIALLGFLALAIDVGVLYSWRRNMQNAADAGALAGARVICTGGSKAEAIAAAEEYAGVQNRADEVVAVVEGDDVVRVTATADVSLFFARVLGTSQSGVVAEAAALCGGTRVGSGLWPIAFHRDTWDAIDCDAEAVIIDSDKTCDDPDVCGNVIMGGNRGWLDYAQPELPGLPDAGCEGNCGADALKCWICNPLTYLPDLPLCLKGEPGEMTKAFKATDPDGHPPQGCPDPIQYAKIPLFDEVTDTGTCPAVDGVTPPTLGVSCPNNRLYRIVDYACVQVIEYDSKYTIEGTDVKNINALKVRKLCGTDCPAWIGGAEGKFIPGGLSAVSLIE